MMKYMSVTIKLDDIVFDIEIEKKVINKLLECKNYSGKLFRVIFYHREMKQKECKDFVKRNQDSLFQLSTDITKLSKDTWMLIDSNNENNSKWRYKWDGGIISGLNEYIRLASHINKRDNR